MPATVQVRIIAVGDELLEGRTSDTNSTRIQRALGDYAAVFRDISVVHDTLDDIAVALSRTEPGDIVFVCGGLGSTGDDLTREAVAAWAGVELEWRDDVAEQLQERYRQRGIRHHLRDDKQPYIPAGCHAVDNPVGSAPGIRGSLNGRHLCVLPGPPSELSGMLPLMVEALDAQGLLPPPRQTRLWRTAQQAEYPLAKLTEPVQADHPDLHWSWWVVPWGVDVRVGAAPGQEDQLEEASCRLDEIMGDVVYAREMIDLPRVVQDLMLARGESLAVAESCTGGLLGSSITAQDGSSGYFKGGVLSYANEVKQGQLGVDEADLVAHGAVSEPVARQMALGAQQRLEATWALSITGIAGPGGGTEEKPVGTTWIALAGPDTVWAVRYRFTTGRERNRSLAVACALDLLRRALTDRPVQALDRFTWARRP